MDRPSIRVLLIEDNALEARLIQERLMHSKGLSIQVECCNRLGIGWARLSHGDIDVVLLDLTLPDSQGIETFRRTLDRAERVPIIILSGLDDEGLAIQCVREGAQDYLVKGRVDVDLLLRAIRYAIERKRSEEALQDERDFVSAVMDAAGALIVVLDREGHIVRMNQAC